jgi:dephospho-CoA kinase
MKQNNKPFLIGITGGIGSGKSEVSKYFKSLGYPLIDADLVSREVVEPGEIGLFRIVEFFGDGILNSDHSLNRGKLAEMIFNNDVLRKQLNDILHPQIRLRIEQHLACYRDERFVFFDVPLLFETDKKSNYDEVILVYTPEAICLERIIKRDKITADLALKKIKAQMSIDLKRAMSDFVIDNNGDISMLHHQLDIYLKSVHDRLK